MICRQQRSKMSLRINTLLLALVCALASCATISDFLGTTRPEVAGGLPARANHAPSGREFIRMTAALSPPQRDQKIVDEILAGNFPDFLRHTVAVKTSIRVGKNAVFNGVFYVLPDYLALGSDKDFVRIPMTPMAAQEIADSFGYLLPTRKMVDLIYKAALLKVPPRPLPAHSAMTSNSYYLRHADILDKQIPASKLGQLIAGHKKDIVLTPRLLKQPYQVAIYGWHQMNGRPIQPLSLVHPNIYADYSHGVRLVHRYMYVNGSKVKVEAVLRDKTLNKLLSDEGPLVKTTLELKSRLPFVAEDDSNFTRARHSKTIAKIEEPSGSSTAE